MKLEGTHHLTMNSGDASRNVEFYADLLGLRLRPQLERILTPLANPRTVGRR